MYIYTPQTHYHMESRDVYFQSLTRDSEVDLRTINTAKKTRFSSTIQGSSKMTEGVFFLFPLKKNLDFHRDNY